MNDTAMFLVCIPTGLLYGVLILNLHADWVAISRREEAERRERETAERDERIRRALEGIEWEGVQTVQKTVQTVQEDEPPRTYARQRTEEPEQEPGVTTEWEEVRYR
jgi:hypothetical protein